MTPKNYSASTVALEDLCPDRMESVRKSVSRDDDLVGRTLGSDESGNSPQ